MLLGMKPSPAEAPLLPAAPRRELSLFDSTCVIVGIIIGAGIYRSTPDIAGCVPSAGWLVAVWVFGGLFALVGAMCYAELASAYPKAGGDYVYLTRAYDRPLGFLFAWAELWVVRPGSLGAMAFAFAEYANRIWPQAEGEAARRVALAYAVGAIGVLTLINALGVRQGKWTQNILTVAKFVGLMAVVVVGFSMRAPQPADKHGPPAAQATAVQSSAAQSSATERNDAGQDAAAQNDAANESASKADTPKTDAPGESDSRADGPNQNTPAAPAQWVIPVLGWPVAAVDWSAFGLAMILVLFTYGGWNEMGYIGAEVRHPERNIFRALMLGTAAVVAIYVLVNLAFVHAVGFEGVRSKTVATDVLRLALGRGAEAAMAALICVSALGVINGQIFTGARIYYAMGRDHALYAPLGRWNARLDTPLVSLLVQASVTIALVLGFGLSGDGFNRLVNFTAPPFWFFLFLVAISVLVFRAQEPDVPRPYRVFAYPVTPLLLAMGCLYMMYASVNWAIANRSGEAFWAIGILVLGVALSFVRDGVSSTNGNGPAEPNSQEPDGRGGQSIA